MPVIWRDNDDRGGVGQSMRHMSVRGGDIDGSMVQSMRNLRGRDMENGVEVEVPLMRQLRSRDGEVTSVGRLVSAEGDERVGSSSKRVMSELDKYGIKEGDVGEDREFGRRSLSSPDLEIEGRGWRVRGEKGKGKMLGRGRKGGKPPLPDRQGVMEDGRRDKDALRRRGQKKSVAGGGGGMTGTRQVLAKAKKMFSKSKGRTRPRVVESGGERLQDLEGGEGRVADRVVGGEGESRRDIVVGKNVQSSSSDPRDEKANTNMRAILLQRIGEVGAKIATADENIKENEAMIEKLLGEIRARRSESENWEKEIIAHKREFQETERKQLERIATIEHERRLAEAKQENIARMMEENAYA